MKMRKILNNFESNLNFTINFEKQNRLYLTQYYLVWLLNKLFFLNVSKHLLLILNSPRLTPFSLCFLNQSRI